ncbi:hypothetical protein E5676_scaffold218G00300 [Cucumis melo var. makuwa]|uniref:Uncharacterized protein n=1 Tax=Cucumis melo var. makuwa TaxID=1194695 RepID=A0A5D3BUR1_CUCMM|nr:hypothetical protein E5676_scaffold218G00300 [Cucumis melo var. makuwa]
MARWLKKAWRLSWDAGAARGWRYRCAGQVGSWRMGARSSDDVTLFRLRRSLMVDDGTGWWMTNRRY